MVGTSTGDVHHQKQGTGLATVLDSSEANRYAYLYRMGKKKALDEKAAQKKLALKDLMSYSPEYFIKHDGELKGEVDAVVNDGAALLSSGIDDLYTSQDPRAIAWRQRKTRTDQMAFMSKQMKDQWSKYQDDINKAGADDYDPKTIISIGDYFNTPLSKVVDEGILPPNLIKKYPYSDGFKFMSELMGDFDTKQNGNEATDAQVLDYVRASMLEPANQDRFVKAYGSKLAQMTQFEKDDIKSRADLAGVQPYVIMAYDDAQRTRARKKPFDPLSELTAMAGAIKPQEVSVSGPTGGYSVTDEKDIKRQLQAVILAGFNKRPEWMSYYSQSIPRDEEETDGEYAQRVREQMARDVDALVKKDRKSFKTDKGAGDQERIARRNQWIQDIRSDDNRAKWSASQWLVGGKVFQNMEVEWSNIGEENGKKYIEMNLKTPMSVREVSQAVSAGGVQPVSESEVLVNADGTKRVRFEFDNDGVANQYFATLYDKVFDDRKQNYDPTLTERTVKTAAQIPMAPANSNRGSLNSLFK